MTNGYSQAARLGRKISFAADTLERLPATEQLRRYLNPLQLDAVEIGNMKGNALLHNRDEYMMDLFASRSFDDAISRWTSAIKSNIKWERTRNTSFAQPSETVLRSLDADVEKLSDITSPIKGCFFKACSRPFHKAVATLSTGITTNYPRIVPEIDAVLAKYLGRTPPDFEDGTKSNFIDVVMGALASWHATFQLNALIDFDYRTVSDN